MKEIDYKGRPQLLDLVQSSFNENLMYIAALELLLKYKKTNRLKYVIDIGCATGCFSYKILSFFNVEKLLCVDIDKEYLRQAKNKLKTFAKITNIEIKNINIFDLKLQSKADLILLGSMYHHIKDEKKSDFLKIVNKFLVYDGFVLVNENFINPYLNEKEYKKALVLFYRELKDNLIEYEKDIVLNILEKSKNYGINGTYEYKVSFDIFLNHIKQANFRIIDLKKVWPIFYNPHLDFFTGSFSILLQKNK